MAKLNELQKKVLAFVKNHRELAGVKSDILVNVLGIKTDIKNVGKIVDGVYGGTKYADELKFYLMTGTIDAVSIGAGVAIRGKAKVNSFKAWYTEYAYKPWGATDKEKWSERVNNLNRLAEIKSDIRASIKAGQSMQQAAQFLHDKGIQKADVAKDIQKIIDKARTLHALSDDSEGYIKFKSEVAKVQKRINTLTRQDTSKLRRAYQDILDLTNKSSAAQVERAIKYTSYFKERYNAERIARTEMGRAYGDAAFSDAIYNNDVVGVKFMLSSGHPEPDECDAIAGADLYGMGAGVYPKNLAPSFPVHVNCLCSLVKVFDDEAKQATAKDYDPNGGKKFLEKLPESKRKQILGVKGAREFEENKNSWEDTIKRHGLKIKEKKEAIISKEILYGGK
jgi:hypothetical protein